MDPNFNCTICSQTAIHFCMCSPEKVYLCTQCALCHLSTGAVHLFAPVSAPINNINEIKDYNQKFELAQSLSGTLDTLAAKLTTEHSQLYEFLNQRYIAQMNQLFSAYSKAISDIGAVYQGIRSAIQASKAEIIQWGQRGIVGFSADTLGFLEVAHTWQTANLQFVVVEAEVAKRVSLRVEDTDLRQENYLQSVLGSWMLPKCQCAECQTRIQMFEPEMGVANGRGRSQSQDSAEPSRISKCAPLRSINSQPGFPPSQSCSLHFASANPYWTCACGYEYNFTKACEKCKGPQSLIRPKPDIPEHMLPPASPGHWTCSVCMYEFNRDSDLTCGRPTCGRQKTLPKVTWMCPNCSQENAQIAEMCRKCMVKKGWDNYLESNGLKLSEDKTKWKCPKCEQFVNISDTKCGNCSTMPIAIAKGLEGEGRKITLFGKLKSLFS